MVNLMVNNETQAGHSFAALSHPIRRRIVERLARGPASVGEASAGLGVSKPAISKHLRVLEEAKLVVRVIDGRRHRLALNERSLADAAAWIESQRALWERKFDVVEEYLDEKERR